MSGSLDGRHAIITGASQGLGRAIAEAYVAAGASVLLCARDGALAAEVAETLRSQASTRQRIESMRADVAVADEVDARLRPLTGRPGCGRSRSTCWDRCCAVAPSCRT